MDNIRPCRTKSHADLALEWDKLAEERHRQITSGEDLSFEHVVVPTTLALLSDSDTAVVIDIGSGTGEFTARLAELAAQVIGLEPSPASMDIARTVCRDRRNVRFIQAPVEEAASLLGRESATAAVAVMTLMTTPDLQAFARSLATLLKTGGKFVATLTHPAFWPRYWGYEREPWFDYEKQIFIEAPFVISKHRTDVVTTHVHRPLEKYIDVFSAAGFRLDAALEPMPPSEIRALYPSPWQFPRFLGLRWVKAV